MDGSRFDALSRALVAGHSRRGLTRLLGSLVLGGSLPVVGLTQTEAKGKKRGGKKRRKQQGRVSSPPPSSSSPGPSPPPVCTSPCTGGRVCQAGDVCRCPSGTRECFNGNCGACCSNFDCCTPPDGQFICPPGSQTCLNTIPRICGYSCTDQVKNGSESDIDCGGSCAPCALGKICNSHQDCASSKCLAGRCVECLTTADCQGTQSCDTSTGQCMYGGGSGDGGGGGDS